MRSEENNGKYPLKAALARHQHSLAFSWNKWGLIPGVTIEPRCPLHLPLYPVKAMPRHFVWTACSLILLLTLQEANSMFATQEQDLGIHVWKPPLAPQRPWAISNAGRAPVAFEYYCLPKSKILTSLEGFHKLFLLFTPSYLNSRLCWLLVSSPGLWILQALKSLCKWQQLHLFHESISNGPSEKG